MGNSLGAILPFLLMALIFVLLFLGPSRARARMAAKTRELQESLTLGTEVMTTSGLYGTVRGLADETVDLEIAPGIVVTFVRQAIAEVRTPEVDADAEVEADAEAIAEQDETTVSDKSELADAQAGKTSSSK